MPVKRFELEIQKAVALKSLVAPVCWEAYVVGTSRFFRLYIKNQPEVDVGGDYGESFLERVSPEEFYDWVAGTYRGRGGD